jgi:hypothetical protein
MKKQLLIISLLFLLKSEGFLFGQQTVFSKVFYDGNSTNGASVIKAFDSGYIIAGDNSYEGFIMKLDTAGSIVWRKQIGNHSPEKLTCIIPTHDSCYLAVGEMYNPVDNHVEIACIKITTAGDTLWSKIINTPSNAKTFSVCQTFDRGFVVAGYIDDNTAPYYKAIAIKIDSVGNHEWSNVLTLGSSLNFGNSIKQCPDSGFVIACSFKNSTSDLNAGLIKLSPSGNIQWAKKYVIAGSDVSGLDIIPTNDGYLSLLSVNLNPSLVKTDFSGNVIWSKRYDLYMNGSYYCDCPYSKINPTYDGGYIFTGTQGIIKLDSTCNVLWSKYLFLYSVNAIESEDHGYFILGNGPLLGVHPLTTYAPQIGVIKTDTAGNATDCIMDDLVSSYTDSITAQTISVTSFSTGLSDAINPVIVNPSILDYVGCVSFLGNVNNAEAENELNVFPNPFTDFTMVKFSEVQKNVEIIFYDVLGKEVYNSGLFAEIKEVLIPKGNMKEGMYILHVKTEKSTLNSKIIIQ